MLTGLLASLPVPSPRRQASTLGARPVKTEKTDDNFIGQPQSEAGAVETTATEAEGTPFAPLDFEVTVGASINTDCSGEIGDRYHQSLWELNCHPD